MCLTATPAPAPTAAPLTPEQADTVARHRRLVFTAVNRMRGYLRRHGVPLEDAEGEGYLGLIRAVQVYRPEKGYAFSTFAVKVITNRVTRFVGRQKPLAQEPDLAPGEDGGYLAQRVAAPADDDPCPWAAEVLGALEGLEREYVELHLGLTGYAPMGAGELARYFGVGPDEAARVLHQGLTALRSAGRARPGKPKRRPAAA